MIVFEKTGERNSEETMRLALERAGELGIRQVVVPTTSGRSGLRAAETFRDHDLVVVTHSTGFASAGEQQADAGTLDRIREMGASVLTATHAFGGVGRAVRRKFGSYQVDEVMAQTLRIFGQGTKVAVEIALMAADAGLLPVTQDAMALGGTGRGVDTALVLRPAHAQDLFNLRVREIVCKPCLDDA